MRVLHLVKTSRGASWALRQMRELKRLGVDVHVALPAGGPLFSRYEEAGIAVHPAQLSFPIIEPWRVPALLAAMRRLVDRVAPDVIHSHFVGTTLTMRLALGRRRGPPRVFQVPGPLHLEHAFFRSAEIRSAGPRDYWIGSCRWTCDRYERSGIAADRIFLSYYGTDIEGWDDLPRGRLRSELGLDENDRIVGTVAYMYAPKRHLGQTRGLKGHEDLIDALALCMRGDRTLHGVFIGGAWEGADAYEKRLRVYGKKRCGARAVFLGTRDDVRALYADLDVAVHPSLSENVGGAVESLLAGVPTITTDVGGFPDLVRHGETGWTVPPRDPVRLAAAIRTVLAEPEAGRRTAARGRALAVDMFDVQRTAQEVAGIYERVLSCRKS
jgi:glycosyltransferase involved in cell wall biosynthesis